MQGNITYEVSIQDSEFRHQFFGLDHFDTFLEAKLHFNKLMMVAKLNDLISIYVNDRVIYRVLNEGIHKGKIIIDKTGPDWV